jgi:2-oxoisovalerate ferredoxin oxidoreductase alpha subunit
MPRELVKGNEAVIKAAIIAGCECYFGYPITPASEIAETAALLFPLVGRTFIQAESEIAAIQMVYGATGAGVRAMTASSGPGVSLKQEGISYCAGSEVPAVLVDVMRGGPGLGNIAPEQGDYNQIVKGGGHGCYKCLVLAPYSAQEMCDLTIKAFELADKYRNPTVVLTDGFIGQMVEAVDFPTDFPKIPEKDWATDGTAKTTNNLINSIRLAPDDLEKHNFHLAAKYEKMQKEDVLYEGYKIDDAQLVLVAYGITSRILITVVDKAREKGLAVGLLRPITLFPFPNEILEKLANSTKVKGFMVVEMSTGQMVDDVKLATQFKKPIHTHFRAGGNLPTVEEVLTKVEKLFG